MYLEKIRLDGRVAMVVGAGGGGHGTAACMALAEAGADIVALDISAENLQDTRRRVEGLGRRCLCLTGDVRIKRDVDEMVAAALQQFGTLHGLVNVVGGMQPGQFKPLLECTEDLFDAIIDMNLRYAFMTCQAVVRSMVERNIAGSIVNVGSVSAFPSAPSHGVYGAAKAGLNTLSRTMALEWSGHGIRVNVVAPGKMVVPRQARLGRAAPGQPQSYEDALAKPVPNEDIPLRRMGTAGDIGSAILFLLSDLASYVTGQVLSVDGGLNVKSVLTGPAARTL